MSFFSSCGVVSDFSADVSSDHGELRYSVRSALNSFSSGVLRRLHVLTADLPSNTLLRDTIYPPQSNDVEARGPELLVNSSRLGQIPDWLSKNADSSLPPLSITHHSEFFANDTHLPTFNSLSIESQFPFIASIDTEFFLYLNVILCSLTLTQFGMLTPFLYTG